MIQFIAIPLLIIFEWELLSWEVPFLIWKHVSSGYLLPENEFPGEEIVCYNGIEVEGQNVALLQWLGMMQDYERLIRQWTKQMARPLQPTYQYIYKYAGETASFASLCQWMIEKYLKGRVLETTQGKFRPFTCRSHSRSGWQ